MNDLTKTETHLPDVLRDELLREATEHAETLGVDDLTTPFLRVAQALTPQLDKDHEDYIEGLDQGDFFITATGENLGNEITIVPCAYRATWYEFVPRDNGGGFEGEIDPPALASSRDIKIELENGNEAIRTHDHYVLVVKDNGETFPAILTCSGTFLTPSKKLNGLVTSARIPGSEPPVKAPRVATIFHATTVKKENDKGRWYVPSFRAFTEGSLIPFEDSAHWSHVYAAAKSFRDAVLAGDVKIEARDDGQPEEKAATGTPF